MQRRNTNNLYNQMSDIINLTHANYQEFIEYKNLKCVEYPYMSFNELDTAISCLERISHNLGTHILGDIMNIDKKEAIMGNVYQNIMKSFHLKFYNYSDNEFNSALIQGLKMQYYLIEHIEITIQDFFKKILANYCGSCEDEIIKDELSDIWQDIEFKYSMSKESHKKHNDNMRRIISQQTSLNKAGYFWRTYLDTLIRETIDELISMTDEDLASDKTFSKALCLHILLRAIFMIIGDYKELLPYEDYYNEREANETRSKKLIREAFIMHYNDAMNEEIKMLAKNKIIDL